MAHFALKPLLFALSPGHAHAVAFAALGVAENVGAVRSRVRASFAPKADPRLEVRSMGLAFASPLGLAAGFDKNARRPLSLSALGFGHLELGTVTACAQEANPEPNLFRLQADRALVNRLGFPNDGAERVAARVRAARPHARGVPWGVSIGKSRAVDVLDLDAVLADYVTSYDHVRSAADFVVVNVSSPNTAGLRGLQAREHARRLFAALKSRAAPTDRLLVKIAPDLEDASLEDVLGVVDEMGLAGVVATNTTIGRTGLTTSEAIVSAAGAGGLSGPPLRTRAAEVVRRVRARLGRRVAVIGVGGIETAEHALGMIRAGADLVQMYTGFIYGGPRTPSLVVRGMAEALSREGVTHVSELVGAGA